MCGKPFLTGGQAMLAAATVSQMRETNSGELLPTRRDFAAEIETNKRNSAILLALCFLLLLGMCWSFGYLYHYPDVGTAAGVLLGGGIVLWAFNRGDKAVLSVSGAKQADMIRDRQLINLVDEMRIAAGVPMPEVYIIDSVVPNAFATGRDPEHGKIAVTTGLMEKLNREELQGVIAHEMSHIRNFDIRYMMLVAGIVGAIVLLGDIGGHGMWYSGGRRRDSSGKGGGPLALLALAFIILAPVFAFLLQMAVSRKREFLADASAAELTRNPNGLASALEKIDNYEAADLLEGASKATQHLYIANPFKKYRMRSSALLSTHPPMEARIRLLRSMVI
jgi:heat shock protein HtpX